MTEQIARTARLMDVVDALYEGREVFYRYTRTVADLMSRVEFLTLDNTLEDVLRFFLKHHCRHCPVVEREKSRGEQIQETFHFIGIVSHRDIARMMSPGVGTPMETDQDAALLKQPLFLSEALSRRVHTATEQTPLLEAIGMMLTHKVDSLPVVQDAASERCPVGIITSTDIIRCFIRLQILSRARCTKAQKDRLIDLVRRGGMEQPTESVVESLFGKASQLMSKKPISLNQSQPLSKAMELMVEHGIRHLPVVDDSGKLVGIISDRNILSRLPPLSRETADKPRDTSSGFRAKLFDLDRRDAETIKVLNTDVGSIMSRKVVSVDLETPIPDVVETLYKRQIGAILVLADGGSMVAGIVTQTDVLEAIHAITKLRHLSDAAQVSKSSVSLSSLGPENT